MHTDLASLCINHRRSLQEAIVQMDRSRLGIVLVVDEAQQLQGTMTDGDVRRAILAKLDLQQPVQVLLASKVGTPFAHPITAAIGEDPGVYLSLLKQHGILQLPILDAGGRVVGVVTMDEFLPNHVLPLQAVVMAGGRGSRLHPLTEELPKPMLPVGHRPLLEIIISRLRDAGITQVKLATHHLQEKIVEHFQDGRDFGVELSYVTEERPLGTVGGLGLLEAPKETTLVMNGDILTQVDFRAMLAYHQEHRADLTMAVRQYDVKVPYGVVECDGSVVRRLREKPNVGLFVNAGIYLLEPSVYRFIPSGQRFDMTDLIQRLISEERMVVSFPIREYWLDIGEHDEYLQAEQDIREEKVRL